MINMICTIKHASGRKITQLAVQQATHSLLLKTAAGRNITGGWKAGGGGFVAAQTEVSAGGPGSLFATCHNNPAGNQDTFTDNVFRLRGGEKRHRETRYQTRAKFLSDFFFVTKEEKQLQGSSSPSVIVSCAPVGPIS